MIRNILEYLEHSALVFEDKIAFADEDTELSFFRTMELSRRIGSALADLGTDKFPVAVFMEKTPWAITAFFGAVYSGRCYCPIDAQMPTRRVEQILNTLKTKWLIVDRKTADKVREISYSGSVLIYEELIDSVINESQLAQIRRNMIDTDPLYIIFRTLPAHLTIHFFPWTIIHCLVPPCAVPVFSVITYSSGTPDN